MHVTPSSAPSDPDRTSPDESGAQTIISGVAASFCLVISTLKSSYDTLRYPNKITYLSNNSNLFFKAGIKELRLIAGGLDEVCE